MKKKLIPKSFTATEAQVEWLGQQPNASELIREIIDGLMTAASLGDEANRTMIAEIGITIIEGELGRLEDKRKKYKIEDAETRRYGGKYWEVTEPGRPHGDPWSLSKDKPEDMETLAYWRAKIEALDRAIGELRSKLQAAREEFIQLVG